MKRLLVLVGLLCLTASAQGSSQEALVRGSVVAVEEDSISIRYRDAGGNRLSHRLPRAFLEDLDLRPGLSHVLVGNAKPPQTGSRQGQGLLSVLQYQRLTAQQRDLYIQALQDLYLYLEGLQTHQGEPIQFSRNFLWPRAYAQATNSSQCAVGGHILEKDSRGLCPTGARPCPSDLLEGRAAASTFRCGILFGGVCVDRFEQGGRVGSLTQRCLSAARGGGARVFPQNYFDLQSNFFPQLSKLLSSSNTESRTSISNPQRIMSETVDEIRGHFLSEATKDKPFIFSVPQDQTSRVKPQRGRASCSDSGKAYSFVRLSSNPLGFDRMVVGPSGVQMWQSGHPAGSALVVDNFSYQQEQGGVSYRCDHGGVGGISRGWTLRGVTTGSGKGPGPIVYPARDQEGSVYTKVFSTNFRRTGAQDSASRHPVRVEISSDTPMRIVTQFESLPAGRAGAGAEQTEDYRLIVECEKDGGSQSTTYRTRAWIEKRARGAAQWESMDPIVVETQEESCYLNNRRGDGYCHDSFGFSSGYMNLLEPKPSSDVRCPSEFKEIQSPPGSQTLE